MSQPYTRQHFLPASYLRNFSIDPSHCRRDSWLWRVDKTNATLVRVDSQCASKFHYSRNLAEQVELMFQVSEERYCRCLDTLKSERSLSPRQYGDLLVSMFDLHLRNAAHVNLTGQEGIAAYNIRSTLFLNQLLLGRKDGNATKEEIGAYIRAHWNIRILLAAPGHMFIASDNPSVLLEMPHRSGGVHVALLPLTPDRLAVAFDHRIVQFVDQPISPAELAILNGEQISNSDRCLYSSVPFQPDVLAAIQDHFKTQQYPAPSELTGDSWHINLRILSPERHFSFLRYTPPIL